MHQLAIPLFSALFFCQALVAQTDTVPPHLVCRAPQYFTTFMCVEKFKASDFIETLSDAGSGVANLGLRKVCTGTGFPAQDSILYIFGEYGTQLEVEVWARDHSGNESVCTAIASVHSPNCDPGSTVVTTTQWGLPLPAVEVDVQRSRCNGMPSPWDLPIVTDAQGFWGQFGAVLAYVGFNTTVRPKKASKPLNGITTFDLVLIQRHILGLEPLDAPWKIVAADANLDGKVTLQDVVLLQKLLLGHIPELPHGQSWRFYPKEHQFADPNNPFLPALPDAIVTPNTADPAPILFQFTGVKIGDVNGNADPEQ